MQTHADAVANQSRAAEGFSLEPGQPGSEGRLLFKGRPVVTMPGQVLEATFAFPDHSTLLLVSDNTPFQELLTIVLVGPDLRERDRVMVGGAYPQGFLAYAEWHGADEVAFCWHDLELVVTVRRYWSWFSLRRRWLRLRDTIPQREPTVRVRAPKR